jgi:hypothetical protein
MPQLAATQRVAAAHTAAWNKSIQWVLSIDDDRVFAVDISQDVDEATFTVRSKPFSLILLFLSPL